MDRVSAFLIGVIVLFMGLAFVGLHVANYMNQAAEISRQVATETAPNVPTATIMKLEYSPPLGSIQPNYYVTVQGNDTKTNKEITLRYDVRPALYEKLHEGDVVSVADLQK